MAAHQEHKMEEIRAQKKTKGAGKNHSKHVSPNKKNKTSPKNVLDLSTYFRVRKIPRFNLPSAWEEITQFFGEEMLPSWLRSDPYEFTRASLHTGYYRDIGIHTEPFVWFPETIPSQSGVEYASYYTMVNKLDYLERLVQETLVVDTEESLRVQKRILEVQDAFQLLSLHMELHRHYKTDDIFTQEDATLEGCTPRSVLLPAPDKIFTLGELPDLIMPIFYCKFWGTKLESPFRDPYLTKLIDIISKAIPSPCKARSVTDVIPDSWGERNVGYGDFLLDVLVRLLFGSLLGVYDHCRVVASFSVRRRLYRWFCLSRPTREEMALWMKENKYLLIYVLREYLFFAIRELPALHDYLSDHYYWYYMEQNTLNAMDEVRSVINDRMLQYANLHPILDGRGRTLYDEYLSAWMYFQESPDLPDPLPWHAGGSWFVGTEEMLNVYNKKNLDYAPRTKETWLEQKIKNCTNQIDDELYLDKTKKGLYKDTRKLLPMGKTFIEAFVMGAFTPEEPISCEWLVPWFKVRLYSVLRIIEACKQYQRETKRSMLLTVLRELAKHCAYDYEVLKTFFHALHKRRTLRAYALPANIARAQMDIFRKKYELLHDQELPELAGIYYYCDNCRSMKSSVVPAGDGRDPRRGEGSLFSEDICIDMGTLELYCSSKVSKSNPKKRNVSTDIVGAVMGKNDKPRNEGKKASKEERKKFIFDQCPHTKLQRINMIGRLLHVESIVHADKNNILFLCPYCIKLTTLSRESYRGQKANLYPSCGCVSEEEEFQVSCTVCKLPIRYNATDPEIKKEAMHIHVVYDDLDTNQKNWSVRYAVFCEKHSCWWLEKFNEILPLSIITRSIREGWMSIPGSHGARFFIQRRDAYKNPGRFSLAVAESKSNEESHSSTNS